VFEHAFPILKRKGIPAALFVVSERIGIAHPLAHDQLFHLLRQRHSAAEAQQLTRNLLHTLAPAEVEKLAQQLGASPRSDAPDLPVTWPMLLELHAAGWTIGSHTRSHARLVGCSQEELADETAGSRKTLEQRLGAPVLHFAYPDGAFNPAAIRALVEAGYQHAYTTCAHRDPLHPELTVPRTMLWEHSSMDASGAFAPSILACQSSGVLELVAGCRTKHLVPVHT